MRRLVLLTALPVVLVPGAPIPAPPARSADEALTVADLAERAYLWRGPQPDPSVLGRPLAYWRAAARTGGVRFGGWAGHAKLQDGPDEVVIPIGDLRATRLGDLFLALAADPDPGVRQVAARGLGGYGGTQDVIKVGALVSLTRDPDPAVRWEAARALRRFGWYVLGEAELDRLTDWMPDQPPEPEYPFGVSPVRPAEVAAVGPRDRPFPWVLALASGADDADLEEVGRFRGLYALLARGSRLTDSGLAGLGRLDRLAVLDLGGTRVTDGGLEHLAGLTRLRRVDLTGTAVTAAGAEWLRAARPDLEVEH